MFFSKRAPKQKGGNLDTLDTPWIRHWISGVETGGSCGSMDRGPRATGCPEWGHGEFRQKCVKWHTCTVHIGFSTAGEVILRTQKASKLLAAGGPNWGSLHRSLGSGARPLQSPTPAVNTSGFQLHPLELKQLRTPPLPSYC